jgi:hypothetical protein
VRETDHDLVWIDELLERSYAGAGRHLISIHTPAARLDAQRLVRELDGMQVLVLATVTADGRPLAGPVEGIFYRGRWCFGTDRLLAADLTVLRA